MSILNLIAEHTTLGNTDQPQTPAPETAAPAAAPVAVVEAPIVIEPAIEWYFRGGERYTRQDIVKTLRPGCGEVNTIVKCNRYHGQYGDRCYYCGDRGRYRATVKVYTKDKLEQLNQNNENRRKAKQRKEDEAREANRTRFSREIPEWDTWAQTFPEDSFGASVMATIINKGRYSDRQLAALRKSYDYEMRNQARKQQWAAENAKSQHLGTVKTRLTVQVTIKAASDYEGHFGPSTWYLLVDENGNQLTYSGTAALGEKGDQIALVGTVKDHKVEKDGTLRTVLARPKVQK